MKRRDLLKGSLAGAAALVMAGRVSAQAKLLPAVPIALGQRDRKLFAIAREQLERRGQNLWERDVVGVVDFGLRSSEPRFHFVNFETGLVDSFRVAHGLGSDPEHDGWLKWFSNVPESQCSSDGAYMTFGWYTGKYGTSVRLEGLDSSNSNALDRAIVMHRAAYAEQAHVDKWGVLGRSNGCFAMGEAEFKRALLQMAGGRLLYAAKLGIGADGEHVAHNAGGPELLVPSGDGKASLNPGVF